LVGGVQVCTAWRVGPRNRLLTSHRCLTDAASVRAAELWFNDECTACGGPRRTVPVKVLGDQLLATDSTVDFTLFSVQGFDSVLGFGYLSVDARDPQPAEQVYIPQHPGGPAAVAVDASQAGTGNCEVDGPAVDGYGAGTDVSYYCDSAGGASGAPVISRVSNKVVALHHFGGCPNAGVRMDLVYQKIQALL
jgi:hypothetical protein